MRVIHGAPTARTNYVIWAMKELGLDFENIPVNPFKGDNKKPEYLALNPTGLIPTLQEDDFILRESMAITYYLAKNFGNGLLWSPDPHEEAEIMQWTFFGILNLDKPAVNCILHGFAFPEEMRDPQVFADSRQALQAHLKILDQHLEGKDYLVGGRFTVADLNLAAMLDYARKARIDFTDFPHMQAWLMRCLERPARLEMNNPK